ncbi:MAG: hypothetical protein KBA91_01055 [Candidatus Moranbacteria bacterium]|jgi:hypothetical protein|nr:hypothetical protein [Candidatus Moranbacteria bacterium]
MRTSFEGTPKPSQHPARQHKEPFDYERVLARARELSALKQSGRQGEGNKPQSAQKPGEHEMKDPFEGD